MVVALTIGLESMGIPLPGETMLITAAIYGADIGPRRTIGGRRDVGLGNGIHYDEPKKWVNSDLVGNLMRIGLFILIFIGCLLLSFLLPR